MRELTKSMFSWTWAMSVFGVQQMMDMAGGMAGSMDCACKAARRFDNVAAAAAGEVGQGLRAAFDAGNNMQRGMVDMMFGSLAMMDPQRWGAMAAGAATPPNGHAGGGMPPNPFTQARPAEARPMDPGYAPPQGRGTMP